MPERRAFRSFLTFTFALGAVLVAPDTQAAAIRSIRSSAGSDYTRIVVDLTQATSFRHGTIPAGPGTPARLYVDLNGVMLDPLRDYTVWIGDVRVRRVRAGQFQANTARIVLELETQVTPKVFQLETPARLVIDLRSTAAPTTMAKAPPQARPLPPPPSRAAVPVVPPSAPPAPASRPVAEPAARVERPPSPVSQAARTPTASRPTAEPDGHAERQLPPAVKPPPTSTQRSAPHVPETTAKAPPAVEPGRKSKPVPLTSASKVPKARKVRIVLDPGHGGRDPGARDSQGVAEKTVVFDISRRLADKLERRLDVEVFLTRTTDEYVDLEERKDIANRVEADLFLSIHANAAKNTKLRGIETYYLKNTNDRATLRLARLENGVDMLIKEGDVSTDADLSFILSDMVQGQKEADSVVLATSIQSQLMSYLRPRYHSVDSLGVKQGPFMVLDGTYMPAILVETGFVTNSMESRRLSSTSYREAVAEGLFRGIQSYLEDERVSGLR